MKVRNEITIVSGPRDQRTTSTVYITRDRKLTERGAERIIRREYPGATVERVECIGIE